MRDSKKSEIKVGVTVIVALIVFLLVFGWASDIDLFENKQVVTVEFDSVSGLEIGDAVTVNGLKKGVVKNIKLDEARVMTEIHLDTDVNLKTDAKFSILMLDLMGGKKIEIHPGKAAELIDLSKVHTGKFLGDISTAMAALSTVQDDLIKLIKDFQLSLDNINTLMADTAFYSDLKSTFTNFNKTSREMNLLIKTNKETINSLLNEGKILAQKGTEFFEMNTDQVSSFFGNSQKLLTDLNSLTENADKILIETREQKNNLGKLLYDESLLDSLKGSTTELRELLKLLTEQLKNDGIKVDADIF